MKLVFYTVSVEILTHMEFQRSAMYGFRVTTRRKIDFSEIFSLPIVSKSTITLSEINFMTSLVPRLVRRRGEKSLVHTVCACSVFPGFLGIRKLADITP